MTLEQRLARLERRNRFFVAGLVVALAAVGGGLMAGCMPSPTKGPLGEASVETRFDGDHPDIYYVGYPRPNGLHQWLAKRGINWEFPYAGFRGQPYLHDSRGTKLRFYGKCGVGQRGNGTQNKIAIFEMGGKSKVLDAPSTLTYLNDNDEIAAWVSGGKNGTVHFSGGTSIQARGFVIDSDARFFVNDHALYAIADPRNPLACTNPMLDHKEGSVSEWPWTRLFATERKVWLFMPRWEPKNDIVCEVFVKSDRWEKAGEEVIKCPEKVGRIFYMYDFHTTTERLLLYHIRGDPIMINSAGYVLDMRSGKMSDLPTHEPAIFLNPKFFNGSG